MLMNSESKHFTTYMECEHSPINNLFVKIAMTVGYTHVGEPSRNPNAT